MSNVPAQHHGTEHDNVACTGMKSTEVWFLLQGSSKRANACTQQGLCGAQLVCGVGLVDGSAVFPVCASWFAACFPAATIPSTALLFVTMHSEAKQLTWEKQRTQSLDVCSRNHEAIYAGMTTAMGVDPLVRALQLRSIQYNSSHLHCWVQQPAGRIRAATQS
jgi:hypothetical protein